MANNKREIKAMIKQLIKMGIRVSGGGIDRRSMGHYKVYPPDKTKEVITISTTSNDYNVLLSIKGDLKRAGIILK